LEPLTLIVAVTGTAPETVLPSAGWVTQTVTEYAPDDGPLV
jgi:hypothetical protein